MLVSHKVIRAEVFIRSIESGLVEQYEKDLVHLLKTVEIEKQAWGSLPPSNSSLVMRGVMVALVCSSAFSSTAFLHYGIVSLFPINAF
jgi:acid phosphatase family membrane protein YuiD